MMKNSIVVISILCVFYAFSQKEISTQTHAWIMYTGNHRLTDKIGFHTEYQWRRANFLNSWQQSLTRLGIDYYAKNGLQLTAGYGWILTFPYGEQPIAYKNNEHRIWQQLITKNKVGRMDFQHRYRLEQRLIEKKVLNSGGAFEHDGYNFRQRIRYRFLVNIPLNNKEMQDKTLFLSLYDEVFLGFGKGIGKNILDQNRLYGALGWKLNAACNFQLGYLNQFVVKSDGVHMERNHTLQMALFYNLDFRKK